MASTTHRHTGCRPQPAEAPVLHKERPTSHCLCRADVTVSVMDRLRVLALAQGYFTRADALAEGHDDRAIRRATRTRLWHRIRQGVYTFTDLWLAADESERHLTTARSVMRRHGNRVALSHVSAAIAHGLAQYGQDLTTVHVTRLDGGAGRQEAGVWHHEGLLLDDDLVELDGMLVVKPERAALEAAFLVPQGPALVTLDSAARMLGGTEPILAVFELLQSWPGARRIQVVVRLANGGAESIGESLSRHLMFVHHLPMPELQFEVYDDRGNLVGTCDFAWEEHRLLGEFDGKVKYGRLLKPGEEPGDAVFREKVREDKLREASNFGMIRFIWADLFRAPATAARLRRMLSRAA